MANKVEIQIDGNNKGAVTAINSVEKKLLDLDRVGAGVTKSMGSLGGIFSGLINPSFMIGAGITALVGGFTAMIGKSIQLAEQLNAVSQKTGISVEALSQLKYAAELSETSLESLQVGLKKMSTAVMEAQGSTDAASKTFGLMDISLKDNQGNLKNNETLLMNVADKFSKMADGSTKTALAVKIFGRSGTELIPMLNEGAAGIDKMRREADDLGLTISTQTAKDADTFRDSLETLKATAEGLAITVLPSLLNALNGITESIKNMHLGEKIPEMIELYKKISPGLNFMQGKDVIDNMAFQNKLLKQGYIDATAYSNVLEGTVDSLRADRLAFEGIVNSSGIFKTDIKISSEETNKLGKEWSNIALKLKNDITLAGLTPMNALIFKHVEEAEKLLQKYQGIAGATDLIREHLLVGLTSEIFKEAKPAKQTEIGTPGDLVPGFNMEQIQFLHDQQIALAADVTDQELAMYALREGAFTDMLGNMADAMHMFGNISGNTNKTLFAFYKAFAIGEAGVATYLAATKALAEVPFPFNFAAAAAVTVAGLANIARIASMQPGSTGGGGGGMGGSSLSLPASSSVNNTNNYGGNRQVTVNIYGFVGMDKDAIARELVPALEKAWDDGVGNG